jgi:hypothetical protein
MEKKSCLEKNIRLYLNTKYFLVYIFLLYNFTFSAQTATKLLIELRINNY